MTKNGLPKAKEFYEQALKEYGNARRERSDVLFRDAAEKGWNAVVLATNCLIEKEANKKVRSNRERREVLDKMEIKNGKFKRYKFRERFMARAYFLHMNCFYDGVYNEEELERDLKKVKLYIQDVEKAIQ